MNYLGLIGNEIGSMFQNPTTYNEVPLGKAIQQFPNYDSASIGGNLTIEPLNWSYSVGNGGGALAPADLLAGYPALLAAHPGAFIFFISRIQIVDQVLIGGGAVGLLDVKYYNLLGDPGIKVASLVSPDNQLAQSPGNTVLAVPEMIAWTHVETNFPPRSLAISSQGYICFVGP